MPKPTLMGLRWVLGSTAALVAAAVWCPQAGAIVGGDPTGVRIEDHPYQVALVKADKTAADPAGQYCGGSVRDEWHVITAAHCVFNTSFSDPGQSARPDQIDVLAGTRDLSQEDAGQRLDVSTISYMTSYDSGVYANDAALLTLAAPLALGDTVRPVSLIDVDWAGVNEPAPDEALYVTGWGRTSTTGMTQTILHGVDVGYVVDDECQNDYFFFEPEVEVCAVRPGKDSCFGDSGGPLVQPGASPPADDRLVGIVSTGGPTCANVSQPGIYTEVGAPAIKDFLTQPNPPAAPAARSAPTLSGSAAIGQRLTCGPGEWTGSPSFSYEFIRSTDAGDVGVAASGPAPDYTVTSQDAGTALRCVVTATNPGGTSSAQSAKTGLVPGQPQPQPNPPQTSLDLYAPVARITRTRCTVTRCTLTVVVKDAGFSAGIKALQATVRSTYRSTCRRNGKKVACTKHKTGKPSVKAAGATTFHVVASKLPIGRQLFTLLAVDKAGHRQALPTRKTVTTKKPTRRR